MLRASLSDKLASTMAEAFPFGGIAADASSPT
jgi:hypothetical protein